MRICMYSLWNRKEGVSQVVGFILTLAIISIVVVSTLYTTSTAITERTKRAAEIEASSISNVIAGSIMEASQLKQWYPYANFSRTVDVPTTLSGYDYYIQLTDDNVYVNTTNGLVSKSSPVYKLGDVNVGISGKAYGSSGKVNVYCNRTDYVYKFDFGTYKSPGEPEYTRVTDACENSHWWNRSFKYRVPIYIHNPNDAALSNYQIDIDLYPTMVDYSHIKPDSSDIRFVSYDGSKEYPYWIERWNANGLSTIWVKVDDIPSNSSKVIYMYYGNESMSSLSDGYNTFDFFDDFSNLDTNVWEVKNGSNVKTEDGYLVFNGSSAIVTQTETLPNNCMIDVKAKSVSNETNETREASMFVRCQNKNLFYNNAYLLLSGSFSNSSMNFAILKDNSTVLTNTTNGGSISNDEWYLSRYILIGNISVALKYFYSDLSYQDGIWCVNYSYPNDGYFGLATTRDGNFTTYYDWIFVHKYSDKPITVVVGGENSLDYYWQDVSSLLSDYTSSGGNLYGDYVYSNTSSNTFVVNLTNGIYSVSIAVGSETMDLSGINISADPSPIMRGKDIGYIFIGSSRYFEDWFVVNVTTGQLKLTFNDLDSDYYWVINSLIIEKGVKGVKIK